MTPRPLGELHHWPCAQWLANRSFAPLAKRADKVREAMQRIDLSAEQTLRGVRTVMRHLLRVLVALLRQARRLKGRWMCRRVGRRGGTGFLAKWSPAWRPFLQDLLVREEQSAERAAIAPASRLSQTRPGRW